MDPGRYGLGPHPCRGGRQPRGTRRRAGRRGGHSCDEGTPGRGVEARLPYQWGATGPHRFDCSGLTLYSYKKAGKKLPRTAAAQYNKTHHVSASHRKAGDLVFFHSGRNVYHVGIYAGKGKIWHSPKTGEVVKLQKIWTRSVWYGRVS